MNKSKIDISIFLGAILPITFLVIWEIAVQFGWLSPAIIAGPLASFNNMFSLIGECGQSGLGNCELAQHSMSSLSRLIGGFILGTSLGIFLGILVGYYQNISRTIEPFLLLLIPVPAIAWIPVLIIFFGYEDLSKIMLIAIGSFATLFLAVSFAVKQVNKDLIELGAVFHKSSFEIIRKIIFPASLSSIFANMRVAMALSWTLLLAAEMISGDNGLGWWIEDSRRFLRPADMICSMIIIGMLGKFTDWLIVKAGRYVNRWQLTLLDVK